MLQSDIPLSCPGWLPQGRESTFALQTKGPASLAAISLRVCYRLSWFAATCVQVRRSGGVDSLSTVSNKARHQPTEGSVHYRVNLEVPTNAAEQCLAPLVGDFLKLLPSQPAYTTVCQHNCARTSPVSLSCFNFPHP